MAKLAVLDKAGKKVSDIELNDGIFAIESGDVWDFEGGHCSRG